MIYSRTTAHLYAARALLASLLALTACSGGGSQPTDDNNGPAGATAGNLVIDAPEARACEVLLSSETARIRSAEYGTNVEGKLRSRSPRTALAVLKVDDTAFAADAIALRLDGAPEAVRIDQVVCYDATGAEVQGATAQLL